MPSRNVKYYRSLLFALSSHRSDVLSLLDTDILSPKMRHLLFAQVVQITKLLPTLQATERLIEDTPPFSRYLSMCEEIDDNYQNYQSQQGGRCEKCIYWHEDKTWNLTHRAELATRKGVCTRRTPAPALLALETETAREVLTIHTGWLDTCALFTEREAAYTTPTSASKS